MIICPFKDLKCYLPLIDGLEEVMGWPPLEQPAHVKKIVLKMKV